MRNEVGGLNWERSGKMDEVGGMSSDWEGRGMRWKGLGKRDKIFRRD